MTHPPLFTVEQSQALRGTIPGGHTKNLFLKDKKDAVFLVVAPEEARVDLKTLHHKLGRRPLLVRLGRPAARNCSASRPAPSRRSARSTTRPARVNVVLDAGLMEHAVINCHPLVNTMTTSIARDDLVKFLEATGHTPRIERGGGGPAERAAEPIAIGRALTHVVGEIQGSGAAAPAREHEQMSLQNLRGDAGRPTAWSRTRPRKAS